MRVLLLGARGMLGTDLAATAPSDVELICRPDPRVDVTRYEEVDHTLDVVRPQVMVNAAGFTAVDRAESEPELANAINGLAIGHLAKASESRGITLVHFSSDYVFSGRATAPYAEDAKRDPQSGYAKSKALGEQQIEESGARSLVIRTQWLFGTHGRSFPRTMMDRAKARLPTRVVNDQRGRPTYTRDLAQWTWALIKNGETGVIHAANAETATWFDVARAIFDRAGAAELLSPCSTDEYPLPAARPAYSVLDINRLAKLLGPIPPWRDALDRFLTEANQSRP